MKIVTILSWYLLNWTEWFNFSSSDNKKWASLLFCSWNLLNSEKVIYDCHIHAFYDQVKRRSFCYTSKTWILFACFKMMCVIYVLKIVCLKWRVLHTWGGRLFSLLIWYYRYLPAQVHLTTQGELNALITTYRIMLTTTSYSDFADKKIKVWLLSFIVLPEYKWIYTIYVS